MGGLFMVLSKPLQLHKDEFAVVSGTVVGINIKRFSTSPEAHDYHSIIDGCLRMAVELPFQYVVIDTEADYISFKKNFDREYERLSAEHAPIRLQLAESVSWLKDIVAKILRGRR